MTISNLNSDQRADRLIITAASLSFQSSVLALIGSIKCNWPGHPPVLIYDLGMEPDFVARLEGYGLEVRTVQPFCPHWRKHFAWKIWCCCDAPTRDYLWLDAGVCVLRPFDEAFRMIDALGYFCVTNHWPLAPSLSRPQQLIAKLSDAEIAQISSAAGGIHGFRKEGIGAELLAVALECARDEEVMRATTSQHRHDQSLLTALLHRFFSPVLYADCQTYEGQTPHEVVNQKIWVHRRRMRLDDLEYFHAALNQIEPPPHLPTWSPPKSKDSLLWRLRVLLASIRGRTPTADHAGSSVYDGVRD